MHMIPKVSIEWIVNRLHVSVTDEFVRADIAKRAKSTGWTPELVLEAQDYAVKCHHENQALYRDVVNGTL